MTPARRRRILGGSSTASKEPPINDSSRTQGGLICAGTLLVGLIFLAGLLGGHWWAVAIPVTVLLAFVLGLVFWVGWTIMTVDLDPEPPAADSGGSDGRAEEPPDEA